MKTRKHQVPRMHQRGTSGNWIDVFITSVIKISCTCCNFWHFDKGAGNPISVWMHGFQVISTGKCRLLLGEKSSKTIELIIPDQEIANWIEKFSAIAMNLWNHLKCWIIFFFIYSVKGNHIDALKINKFDSEFLFY